MKPTLITLTGSTCSGKSTLERMLTHSGVVPLVSTTTRAPRAGETDGVAYHFVSFDTYLAMAMSGDFVEQVEFNNQRYALSVAEVLGKSAEGAVVCAVVEPNGQRQVRRYAAAAGWNVVSVFVDCPVELAMRRFMARFRDEVLCAKTDEALGKLTDTYARRATVMTSQESLWRFDRNSYDVVIPQFDLDCQDKAVGLIIAAVQGKIVAANEKAAQQAAHISA